MRIQLPFLLTTLATLVGLSSQDKHITDILAVAERHKKPIIADEVYAEMVSD